MKSIKKLLAILTIATMVLILPLSAFAADTYQISTSCVDKATSTVIAGAPTTTSAIVKEGTNFIVTAPTVTGYIPVDATKTITAAQCQNTTNPTTTDSLTFLYNKAVKYTVEYKDASGEAIKTAETKEGAVGDSITETAAEIEGFTLNSDSSVTITLDADETKNVITFTYDKNGDYVTYTVSYVDEEGNSLAENTIGTGLVGEVVPIQALEIEGYTLADEEDTVELTLSANEEENFVEFVYKEGSGSGAGAFGGPKTGDAGLILYGLMGLGSLGGAIFGIKKKFF